MKLGFQGRLMMAAAGAGVLTAGLGVVGLHTARGLDERATRLYHAYTAPLVDLAALPAAVEAVGRAAAGSPRTQGTVGSETERAALDAARAALASRRTSLAGGPVDEGEAPLRARTLAALSAFEAAVEAAPLADHSASIAAVHAAVVPWIAAKATGAESLDADGDAAFVRGRWLTIGAAISAVLGLLALALFASRRFARYLGAGIDALGQHVESLRDTAEQVNGASSSLAAGASRQAAALQETSAALEEIASMTRKNAENATEAKGLAAQTRQAAEDGGTGMVELSRAMEEIARSGQEIVEIISVIDDIAFQTNILALNAAVEAARAGEAGMGFAVVADEVRMLARRSAEAAQNTTSRVRASAEHGRVGLELARRMSMAFQQIVDRARATDELVAEIQTSSQEQSSGIDQTHRAVAEMDHIVQQTAAAAEQAASASAGLVDQAGDLETVSADLDAILDGGARSRPDGGPARTRQRASTRRPRPSTGAVGMASVRRTAADRRPRSSPHSARSALPLPTDEVAVP
ncbi:methyl-accepting chemotaxis protein [Myxococcota bacterium]|nr:methyl-accepting chemotaxis protein [Myxococcota bacterium]